ncbi:MAG: sugar ABC transporter ATP-binding protein [Phycisphaerae bacterium]|nr:sugar ABC transporter ATP-binding protein [Phycisphaerae bacterium]
MLLQFDNITKRFPGITALDRVSFAVESGECHAIMGENGAGKSTLGKIVGGILAADGGRLLLDGRPVRFRSPREAATAGIAIVHQELALCPNLPIAENLFLGALPARRGLLRRRHLHRSTERLLAEVGLDVDPTTPMNRLSTAQEQLVQIAAAVGRGARIIVLDEPTSSLTQPDAERIFELMQRLRSAGATMLYVSHRMDEIKRLCGRATILRDGRYITTVRTADTSDDDIVRHMIDRPFDAYCPRHAVQPPGEARLCLEHLSGSAFRDVSFEVRAGEIVGLAGLVGAGRTEVARAIFGIDPISAGRILLNGRAVDINSPRQAVSAGIGLLPEDRKRQALVLSMTCKQNMSLPSLECLGGGRLLINHRAERALATHFFSALRVRAPDIDSPIAGLSGGNQQKIALARWLARRCGVLILDEPTRGVDIGAKAEIHAMIDELAANGMAVLLISSELPELLRLSARILVLTGGRIAGELSRADATQENLMRLMAGAA